MKIGLDTYTYIRQLNSKEWTLEDLLRQIVSLRVDDVDIRLHYPLESSGFPNFRLMLETKAFLNKNGVDIRVFDLGGPACDKTGRWVRRAIESLELAELWGSKVIRIVPGANRDLGKGPQMDLAVGNLKKVMDAAECYDIAFGLENHDVLADVTDIKKIIDGVDSKYLGIVLDTGNMYRAHWEGPPRKGENPVKDIELVAPHVVATHVRDLVYDEETSRWYCVACGDGLVDFQAIGKALKDVSYEGSLAQEFLGMKNEDPMLKDAAIRKGMDYLRKL